MHWLYIYKIDVLCAAVSCPAVFLFFRPQLAAASQCIGFPCQLRGLLRVVVQRMSVALDIGKILLPILQAVHMKGRSIEDRPAIVSEGTEIGHWEIDTVVGQREGREAVAFTAVEKVTRNYIAIRISGRTSAGVEDAMNKLQELYGKERFSQVFKTMTADNGPEFETLSKFESLGTAIYFAHPYSS